jgi:hypothetical protein
MHCNVPTSVLLEEFVELIPERLALSLKFVVTLTFQSIQYDCWQNVF